MNGSHILRLILAVGIVLAPLAMGHTTAHSAAGSIPPAMDGTGHHGAPCEEPDCNDTAIPCCTVSVGHCASEALRIDVWVLNPPNLATDPGLANTDLSERQQNGDIDPPPPRI